MLGRTPSTATRHRGRDHRWSEPDHSDTRRRRDRGREKGLCRTPDRRRARSPTPDQPLPGATGGARHEGAAQRWRRGAARCRALPTPGPTARDRGRDSSARSRCDRTRGGDVRRIPALDWEKIHRTMRRHARGWWPDLPEPRNPRNLLLVRPTGKRRGRKALPPSSGEPPPDPLTCETH